MRLFAFRLNLCINFKNVFSFFQKFPREPTRTWSLAVYGAQAVCVIDCRVTVSGEMMSVTVMVSEDDISQQPDNR